MHPSPPPADLVSLDFLPSPHVRVEAVSPHRGLVCCVDADADADAATPRKPASSYYVCKPATRQWRALPNPRLRYRTAATAMLARPGGGGGGAADFKIVRFSVPTLRDCLRCEVFDSRGMAWRRSADVAVWPESLVEAAPAVRAHGAMHWLRWPDRLSGGAEDIFAFDVKTETWRLIGLPPEATTEKRWARKKVAAVEGKQDVGVRPQEGDERAFLFGVQGPANFGGLGRIIAKGDLLDGHLIGRGEALLGGAGRGGFRGLRLRGCRQVVGTLLRTCEGDLDMSHHHLW